MRSAHRLLIVVTLTGAMFATACGSDSEDALTSTDDTEASEDSTTESSTSEARTPAEIVKEAAAAPAQFETSTIDMLIEMDGEQVMRTTGTSSSDGLTSDMTVEAATGDFRMIVVDGDFYYQFADMPPGVEWILMSAAELTTTTGIDPTASASNATGMLDMLTSFDDELTELGEDELFGDTVTGYRATITRDVMVKQGVESGLYAEELADQMVTTLPETFDMDVWIDEDGMPRRQEWSLEISGAGGGNFTYRYDFPEWGAPLDVTAPPAEVTATMDELRAAGMPS